MATKPRAPILPRNKRDPTGADRLERGAMREFGRRMNRVSNAYVEILHRIPAEPVVNKSMAHATRYTYRLDAQILRLYLDTASAAVDSILLEGGSDNLWFFKDWVEVSYIRGTAQEFANLSQQSAAYKAGQQDVAAILRSDPYRRRLALVAAREFEEMKGLSAAIKGDLARTLTEGIGRGLNPREVAKDIVERTGVGLSRANRIARTEVTGALRRARWDEAEDATDRYGLRTMQMHLSALSPTTRATHAARHGNLYTVEQVRDWYSQDGNAVNCKCAQVATMVDESGNPVVPAIQQRALETKRLMREKHNGPWADEDES